MEHSIYPVVWHNPLSGLYQNAATSTKMSHFNHPDGLNKPIPTIIDELATSYPEKIYAEIPKLVESYAEGYRNVTYREFGNAINGTARWIVDTLGQSKDFETLVYFGPHDIRYAVLLVAAVKAGYKVLINRCMAARMLTGLRCCTLPIVSRLLELSSLSKRSTGKRSLYHWSRILSLRRWRPHIPLILTKYQRSKNY